MAFYCLIAILSTHLQDSAECKAQLGIQRTSDSLNEGLPIKMTREKFQRKRYFFCEKIVALTLELSTKAVFSLDK